MARKLGIGRLGKGVGHLRARLLLVSDVAGMSIALVLAYWVRTRPLQPLFTRHLQPFVDYLWPGSVVIALCLFAVALSRLYQDRRYLSRLEEYTNLVKAMSYGILVSFGVSFFFQIRDYSRSVLLLFWLIGMVLLVLERSVWHQFLKAFRRRGGDVMPVALVGMKRGIDQAGSIIRKFPELGYRLVVRLTIGRGSVGNHVRKVEDLVRRGAIEGVLIGVSTKDYHRAVPYMAWCEENYIPHHRLSAVFDAYHGDTEGTPEFPAVEPKPVYTFTKRIFDEVLAVVVFALTLPLWVLIAAAVKLDSPGPVLFVQDRMGRNGRIFRLFKFRTMFSHSPRYALTVRRKGDPRVTRIGRWLRRTSLDELPQLINILKGEMSFVGPRPEMPFMVRKNSPVYQKRLMVLPGLTGLWQAVARDEPLENSLSYDMYYIRRRSFLYDLVILARTAFTVISGRGAF